VIQGFLEFGFVVVAEGGLQNRPAKFLNLLDNFISRHLADENEQSRSPWFQFGGERFHEIVVDPDIGQSARDAASSIPAPTSDKDLYQAQTQDLGERLRGTLETLKRLGINVLRMETQQSNLERLFLQLTGKRLRD
jgi:hypothetical protein